MRAYDGPAGERDALLERLTAELTGAAYRVALGHGTGGAWLDLELDLWRALKGVIQDWDPARRPGGAAPRPPDDEPPQIVGPREAPADRACLVAGG